RITLGGRGQIRSARLTPPAIMAGCTAFTFKDAAATPRVALLIEVSLRKKVRHEVRHITWTENRETLTGAVLHQRGMVPHGSNVPCQELRCRPLQQIDLRVRGSVAEGMTGFAGIFKRDASQFRIAGLK